MPLDLLSLVWGLRMVTFQLSGFYCKRGTMPIDDNPKASNLLLKGVGWVPSILIRSS